MSVLPEEVETKARGRRAGPRVGDGAILGVGFPHPSAGVVTAEDLSELARGQCERGPVGGAGILLLARAAVFAAVVHQRH